MTRAQALQEPNAWTAGSSEKTSIRTKRFIGQAHLARCVPASIGATLLLLCSTSAIAAPLRAASFGTVISGGLGVYNLTIDRTESEPFSVSTGFVAIDEPGGFDVTANMTGGSSPAARITGYAYQGAVTRAPINAARALVNYSMRIDPAPAFSPTIANLAVPMTVSGLLSTSMQLLPTTGGVSGFAEAYATISGPGIDFRHASASTLNSPTGPLEHETAFARSFSLYSGQVVNVSLTARGKGTGAVFTAYADPVFAIDPSATFIHDGQSVRFVDAVSIEYSPGILPVPEPGTALLLGVGLAILGRSRRGVR